MHQVAAGGQALVGAELAVQNGAAQRLIQLAVQWQPGVLQTADFSQQQLGKHGMALWLAYSAVYGGGGLIHAWQAQVDPCS